MTTLTIKNLPVDKALDRKAMTAVRGGMNIYTSGASASPTWDDLLNWVSDWWNENDGSTINLGTSPAPASPAPATAPLTGSISGSLPGGSQHPH